MITTLGQFADALGALTTVEARKYGRRLYATNQPYSRCATDAERDGYVAGQSEHMQARADQARLRAKLAA